MKERIESVEDDFWTERLPFFTAQFPTYYPELFINLKNRPEKAILWSR